MKILEAWIDDPTLRGEKLPPMLCVSIDEPLEQTATDFLGGYAVQKYGPFSKQSIVLGDGLEHNVSAGRWNVMQGSFARPVVDVAVFLDGSDEPIDEYCIQLGRAKQLIKRHCKDWRLYLSERLAESGSIAWVPVQHNASCRHWLGNRVCGATPARTVRLGSFEMPMCSAHLTAHNDSRAAERRGKTS